MKKILMISFLTFYFSIYEMYSQKDILTIWEVPLEYQNQKNPYLNNKENIRFGKDFYTNNCKSCHNPDKMTEKAISLNMSKEMVDFSSLIFQTQSEGSLFYKIKTGKGHMPFFDKKLYDDEIWLVVHYMKSLSKKLDNLE